MLLWVCWAGRCADLSDVALCFRELRNLAFAKSKPLTPDVPSPTTCGRNAERFETAKDSLQVKTNGG